VQQVTARPRPRSRNIHRQILSSVVHPPLALSGHPATRRLTNQRAPRPPTLGPYQQYASAGADRRGLTDEDLAALIADATDASWLT
jgi:hypothetical protein